MDNIIGKSLFPITCVYVNRSAPGETEDSIDFKIDSLKMYCESGYDDLHWYIDDHRSTENFNQMLKDCDNGVSYNTVILHDFNQLDPQCMKDLKKAAWAGRVSVATVLLPIPMED